MFGMILKFQAFMERLKKRKALWFSTLITLSVLGIIGTLYYLNSMTNRAAKNLYEATNSSYFHELDMKIADTMLNLEIVGDMLLANPDFVAAINAQGDPNAIAAKLNAMSGSLKKIDQNGIVLELYSKEAVKISSSSRTPVLNAQAYDSLGLQKVLANNQPFSGIEYQDGQVFLHVLYPLQNGVLEVKKSLDFLFDVYKSSGKIFQVLMERDLMDMKKLQEFKYQKVGNFEISVQSHVDADFLERLSGIDFEQLIAAKYVIKDDYFILAKPILNADNKRVGLFIIGENTQKENSLPKMTKKISTGLTTAALGLVVALLVLMI